MPALVVCGRRLTLAGDDLQPLSIVTIAIRIVEAGLSVPIAVFLAANRREVDYFQDATDNSSNQECMVVKSRIQFYVLLAWLALFALYTFCICSIVQEVIAFISSGVGTPSEPHLRHKTLSSIYFIKLYLMPLFELLVFALIFFTSIFTRDELLRCLATFDGYTRLENYIWTLLPCYIGLSAMLMTELVTYTLVHFSRFGGFLWNKARKSRGVVEDLEQQLAMKDEQWQKRCSRLCCCCGLCCCFSFGGTDLERSDFASIGHILTDLFDDGGNLDIVPSDVFMAWQLLKLVQRQRQHETMRVLQQQASKSGLNELAASTKDLFLNYGAGPEILATAADKMARGNSAQSNFSTDELPGRKPLMQNLPSIRECISDESVNAYSLKCDDMLPNTTVDHIVDPMQRWHITQSPQVRPSILSFRSQRISIGDQKVETRIAVRNVLTKESSEALLAIKQAVWFMRYPMAINTWKLYVFLNPISCVPRCTTAPCRYRQQHDYRGNNKRAEEMANTVVEEQFIGDNLFGFHRTAFMEFLQVEKYPIDVAFVQVNNTVEIAPYCICVDHVWKTVVVCIRGSLSLEDYAINVMLDSVPMDEVAAQYGFEASDDYCHKGFLERAKWLCNDIEDKGVLAKLVAGSSSMFPNYGLTMVGHSLGAACAALVAIMLRPKYPNIRCLCYGPPGALVSQNMALKCREFITTFIAGNDLVPSLDLDNMELLRNEVIELVARTKVPKHMALRKCCSAPKDLDASVANIINQILYDKDKIPVSDYKKQMERFVEHQEKRQHDRGLARVTLYPPGRIIHVKQQIRPDPTKSLRDKIQARFVKPCKSTKKKEYSAIWAENDDFQEILVKENMFAHHFPNAYLEFFEGMAEMLDIDNSKP